MDAVRRTIWVPPMPPRPVSRAWQLSPGLREVASCVCWLRCVNRVYATWRCAWVGFQMGALTHAEWTAHATRALVARPL